MLVLLIALIKRTVLAIVRAVMMTVMILTMTVMVSVMTGMMIDSRIVKSVGDGNDNADVG